MTARDQIQLAAELALARSDIEDAQAGLQRFLDLISILDPATVALLPAYRAKHFLTEAAALIEQVGRVAPRAPLGNVGSNDSFAPSAQDARAASALECGGSTPLPLSASSASPRDQESPSLPKTENSVINSADAPASREADGSEGVLSEKESAIPHFK